MDVFSGELLQETNEGEVFLGDKDDLLLYFI